MCQIVHEIHECCPHSTYREHLEKCAQALTAEPRARRAGCIYERTNTITLKAEICEDCLERRKEGMRKAMMEWLGGARLEKLVKKGKKRGGWFGWGS
jgi:hypothetical protein